MVWNRTLQMFALPATNLLRLEIYGLTVRFFDFYLGLPCQDEKPVPRKDLRFNESFFKILQVTRINRIKWNVVIMQI
jgi:hypothetical protein